MHEPDFIEKEKGRRQSLYYSDIFVFSKVYLEKLLNKAPLFSFPSSIHLSLFLLIVYDSSGQPMTGLGRSLFAV